ncbi:MAG TPA: hypothetical protein VJR89_24170 [Polyangiales bacterium]|nr:hypothetical protein [Polyangiales bacterium]
MRFTAALVVVSCVFGCEASLDTSLDHKECSASGECLPGYTCNSEGMCVKHESQREHPDSAADGGGRDSGPEPTTCENGSLCDDACVDTATDPSNCGSCGRQCPSSQHGRATCNAGQCAFECASGYADCDDGCYATAGDPKHCGSCDNSCTPPPGGNVTCEAGRCVVRCQPGFTLCDNQCVRTDVDFGHCGRCETSCGDDQRCSEGQCVLSCPSGTRECARSCVDVQREVEHCGACGQACQAPPGSRPVCQAGKCTVQCDQGRVVCGETCVDPQTDVANCGACGKACPAPPEHAASVCDRGQCLKRCDMGYTDCGGQCVNDASVQMAMMAGLGTLGVCEAQTALMARASCQAMGQTMRYCGGSCVNVSGDTKNCGACGRTCGFFQWCVLGICITPR